MLVDLEKRGLVCVLRLHGRFATGRDSTYLDAKSEEIKSTGLAKVLADFSDVEYIDSTGIGFLISLYTSVLKMDGGDFALASIGRRVRDVLELTRLASIIPIYASEAAALEALACGKSFSAPQS